MARPREFDPDTALERAMRVFWSKGYEAASLDDLCDATGLSHSSLYAVFDDKRNPLPHSLARYVDRGGERVVEALTRKVPFRAALADFLAAFIDATVAGPGRRGCFIGICAWKLRTPLFWVSKSTLNMMSFSNSGSAVSRSRIGFCATQAGHHDAAISIRIGRKSEPQPIPI